MKINKWQLFTLIMLFEIGSTTLFALSIKAGQDAWIAILIGMIAGCVLLLVYTKLYNYFPDKDLADIILTLLGKGIGAPIILFYALYFLYISSINFREFGELITIAFLSKTPIEYTLTIYMFLLIYTLLLGLNVLGRSSQVCLPIILVFTLMIYTLNILSGRADFSGLTPVLENGIKPVLKATYPHRVNFPFGEMIVFMVFWRYVDSKKEIRKMSFWAMIISGVIIIIATIMIIAVLGAELATHITIPFLRVVRAADIGDVISNLDAVATVIMFIGGFYKAAIFFYGGILSISTLFKIKDNKWLIIFIGIGELWFANKFIGSFQFYRWLGDEVHSPYIHNPFQIYIPFLLLCIAWIKEKSKNITG